MPDESSPVGVAGRLVVLAGGTSAAGQAIARALLAAGARVVVVGSNAERLERVGAALRQAQGPDAAQGTESVRTELCDLTDERAVTDLVARIHASDGAVDGLIHLVGGWRGGGGLAGQTDDDYRALEVGLTALRHTSRAFDDDLKGSDAGRLAIVSSTAVARPLAGGANYATVKAASEVWARAVAQGFAKHARDSGHDLTAAAIIYRVKALVGLERTLATAVGDLWEYPAESLNDRVIELTA